MKTPECVNNIKQYIYRISFCFYIDCTDYSIPNVSTILPQKYVGLAGDDVIIDIFYRGHAASFLYNLVCNCSGKMIYNSKMDSKYSLKIVDFNYTCSTRSELKVMHPSSHMSANCTCYVVNDDESEKGKSGTSEIGKILLLLNILTL